jgi:hypothetical protein
MDEEVKNNLEANGWKTGTVQEFLGLTDEESAHVEKRVEVAKMVRDVNDFSDTILAKWRETGLLKGLSGWKERLIAHMLENQEKLHAK